ncbi:MAG: aminotransferase class I/II-fold pyridoxal phosphate-dependent enzyme [Asticcacaulis sp.]|nr:aminotransferase class I/II-fold pyridoxal phosphate-dependent enzyme [Asticcacaulis sp.]
MDGIIARLDEIRALCDRYGALLGVDDSHASGFIGARGRGTHELRGIFGKVDIITGTLGKALGGASGGFTAGRREVVELLRQRSRPYLFSNTVAPMIVGATLAVLDLLEHDTTLRDRLEQNAARFRKGMSELGFELKPGEHPIIPVMTHEAETAQKLSARLLELGLYAVGFFYPVVPKDKARIRVQISAAHTDEELDQALAAFATAGRELGLIR